jgi:hypothetical protein
MLDSRDDVSGDESSSSSEEMDGSGGYSMAKPTTKSAAKPVAKSATVPKGTGKPSEFKASMEDLRRAEERARELKKAAALREANQKNNEEVKAKAISSAKAQAATKKNGPTELSSLPKDKDVLLTFEKSKSNPARTFVYADEEEQAPARKSSSFSQSKLGKSSSSSSSSSFPAGAIDYTIPSQGKPKSKTIDDDDDSDSEAVKKTYSKSKFELYPNANKVDAKSYFGRTQDNIVRTRNDERHSN